MAEIRKEKKHYKKFKSWTKEQQEEFLNICTGVKGLKLLYDGFFKEVMNPEYDSGRLSDFLSCMLRQKVKVIKVIPTDSARLANESALLAMDIVVELEDGGIANVEMQRIGYMFPGQRSACYSADLLLRQYKRVRGNEESFDYRDVKNVYTIVLFEKSPRAFHTFPKTYYHFFEQKSDTGLQMELLEEYPEFKDIYREGYQICLNIEKVMEMFSEELYILDRNTEKYMFEEMQKELNEMQNNLTETRNNLAEAQNSLVETRNNLADTQNNLAETQSNLTEMSDKYNQSVKSTIKILRGMGLSDQEILDKLCGEFQFEEEHVREYL